VKVFISSVISGFEEYRAAAREAVESLGHQPVGAEDFPATVGSPQQACLGAVRESDVVILVLGVRYGDPLASGLSATHEEFNEAVGRKPMLLFVQTGAPAEQAQLDLMQQAQDWTTGLVRAGFTTPAELRSQVVRALHNHELATAAGPIDESDLLSRAEAMLPPERGQGGIPQLQLSVTSGPRQQVIRPARLEDVDWSRVIQREAMFGQYAVLDNRESTKLALEEDALVIRQQQALIAIDETGSVLISLPAYAQADRRFMTIPAIIEEDLTCSLRRCLLFCAWILEQIDPTHRLTTVAPVARLANASYVAWRTRIEQQASPNAATISMKERPAVAVLSPPSRHRQALSHDTDHIVEDLITLLRRGLR
jgi:hypothetical protein